MRLRNDPVENAKQWFGLVATVGLVCLCLGGCTWKMSAATGYKYSSGSRSGTITKFSQKGLIWSTWEGELDLHRLKSTGGERPTTTSDVFHFSVSDPNIAAAVVSAEETGRRVTLKYDQYFMRGWRHGATGYNVTAVVLSDVQAPPAERFPMQ